MPPVRDPFTFVVGFSVLILTAVAIALAVSRVLRDRKHVEAPSSTRAAAEPARQDDGPLCKCGAVATRPAPEVIPRATWWDALRRSIGLPPRYVLSVPAFGAHVYCDAHGRVADVLTEEKLATTVVVQRRAAESVIVCEVARYITSEDEGLPFKVFEAMTKRQQSAFRDRGKVGRGDNVVSISRAANGD